MIPYEIEALYGNIILRSLHMMMRTGASLTQQYTWFGAETTQALIYTCANVLAFVLIYMYYPETKNRRRVSFMTAPYASRIETTFPAALTT